MFGTAVFTGTLPRVSARTLEPHQAQVAENCWLSSRTIRPIPELQEVQTGLGAGVRTIYRFSPTQWFAWPDDVDAVPSPVIGDNVRRTMWTGDGEPKMTTTTIMGTFIGPGVPVSRRLGIPAPDIAPIGDSRCSVRSWTCPPRSFRPRVSPTVPSRTFLQQRPGPQP